MGRLGRRWLSGASGWVHGGCSVALGGRAGGRPGRQAWTASLLAGRRRRRHCACGRRECDRGLAARGWHLAPGVACVSHTTEPVHTACRSGHRALRLVAAAAWPRRDVLARAAEQARRAPAGRAGRAGLRWPVCPGACEVGGGFECACAPASSAGRALHAGSSTC